MEPVDLARAFVAERFPRAEAAFLAGSVATGQATASSDLDIVVLQGDSAAETFRETLRYNGRLVVTFTAKWRVTRQYLAQSVWPVVRLEW